MPISKSQDCTKQLLNKWKFFEAFFVKLTNFGVIGERIQWSSWGFQWEKQRKGSTCYQISAGKNLFNKLNIYNNNLIF